MRPCLATISLVVTVDGCGPVVLCFAPLLVVQVAAFKLVLLCLSGVCHSRQRFKLTRLCHGVNLTELCSFNSDSETWAVWGEQQVYL